MPTPDDRARGRRRIALLLILAVGLSLAAAPAVFQMFSRAPAGGAMIEDFRPYMSNAEIDEFRAHLAEIGAAASERPTGGDSVVAWREQWSDIDEDMGEMLDTMADNVGEFRGVSALPPFRLFPWFFVLPGALVAAVAGAALVAERRGRRWNAARRALIVLGVGVIAAPVIFQMFNRAPGGARMIDDFRPLMSTEKVTAVQQYFLVIGAAEGELRTTVLAEPGGADDLPATARFVEDWPRISYDMAPMIGAMSDNVDSFAGIDALPPFWLFPWFFVFPGALVALLAVSARTVDVAHPRSLPVAEGTVA